MHFRIADTFIDSLAKLTAQEQKAVKTTAFDLQLDPTRPGMRFHRIERARDPNFWSVSVNRDIRLIVHRTKSSILLCYVGHHDDAYRWAERRKLQTHPKTGAAQLVVIPDPIEEVAVRDEALTAGGARIYSLELRPAPLAHVSVAQLLQYGVPPEWVAKLRQADEDTLLNLVEQLPSEAAEAVLDLATGVTPRVSPSAIPGTDPFEHPDALRRFRIINEIEELRRALEYPWEKWIIFLHPSQREIVEKEFNGPARVSGTAGTGKTIVALHRAVFLARKHPDARVLLTTFSKTLANALRIRLKRLISNEPKLAERLEVHALNEVGRRLYELNFGRPNIASPYDIKTILAAASREVHSHKFSLHFLVAEWEQVVDPWQIQTWEDYRNVVRLGRKTRLPEKQRAVLWSIFERVRTAFNERGLITYSELFSALTSKLKSSDYRPFDFAVVDEAQDVSVAQLRFLAALGGNRPNALFFAGDLGQRIFQQPFSWKSVGVDIRGRSHTLRVNYRTSHQIRTRADRLLGPELSDVDGNVEDRRGTISVFNGPQPMIRVFDTPDQEIKAVSDWMLKRIDEGVLPHEISIFVRSRAEIARASAAAKKAGLPFKVLDDNVETTSGNISISTMHLAKGLEFRAVVVMACDDEVIPSQERIEAVAEESDLEDTYATERHLLYVACTRARDFLFVSGVHPASEFLDDIQ